MNLSASWVSSLERFGFEAVHWSTVGAPTAPDAEILSWARERGFVLLTNDLDFSAILAATAGQSASVVQLRAHDLLSDAAVSTVARALDDTSTTWKEVPCSPSTTAERVCGCRHCGADPIRLDSVPTLVVSCCV